MTLGFALISLLSFMAATFEALGVTFIFPIMEGIENHESTKTPFPFNHLTFLFTGYDLDDRLKIVAVLLVIVISLKSLFTYLEALATARLQIISFKHFCLLCYKQLMILGFAYFYASLTINPIDIASNLKKGGVAIPGVRPGGSTSNYLSGVQNRLTLLGGLFLGSVAIVPAAVERATNVQTFQGLGATSLLILVGVAIDTSKQVQTYVISQRYEGLVRQ